MYFQIQLCKFAFQTEIRFRMKYYPFCRAENLPQVVILADGEFPRNTLAVKILGQVQSVVCCDGAVNKLIAHGYQPAAIVGDGDSLSRRIREQYASIIYREEEQDTNDLSKAFRYCLSQGWYHILILGATGKREDHTLGNVSLLTDYMQQAQVEMLTDYGLFTPVCGDAAFEAFPGQQVSIFNMGCSRLNGEGLVYPLSVFTNWWQGTLNESVGKSFKIFTDGKVLVYRTMK